MPGSREREKIDGSPSAERPSTACPRMKAPRSRKRELMSRHRRQQVAPALRSTRSSRNDHSAQIRENQSSSSAFRFFIPNIARSTTRLTTDRVAFIQDPASLRDAPICPTEWSAFRPCRDRVRPRLPLLKKSICHRSVPTTTQPPERPLFKTPTSPRDDPANLTHHVPPQPIKKAAAPQRCRFSYFTSLTNYRDFDFALTFAGAGAYRPI
jgi:hypothetical protein